MIQQTSIDSYQEIQPKINRRHREILTLLSKWRIGLTDQEMAKKLGVSDPNYVRPRRNELVKFGLVKEFDKRICGVTGKRSIAWR